MFSEILEYILYKAKQIVTSRLTPVVLVFIVLFGLLFRQMYQLQILEGAEAEKNVQTTTIRTVDLAPTRGNIYDRNGQLLAYNRLVQNVTVMDDGSYANGYERNHMLIKLLAILDRYGETVQQTVPLYYDENGTLQESFSSDNARLRFLRDMFGKKSVGELSDEQKAATAQDIVNNYLKKFGIGQNADKTTYEVDPQTALKLIYIRYSMYSNYYVRYNASTVARDVKEETIAAVREHAAELLGVDIAQSYTRVYNDSRYFCHILGYTGLASTEEIEELNEQGGNYASGDVVGKAGIEDAMELYLQGTAGSQTMYVNNYGQIQKIIETEDPKAGDDVYLSIDADLQKVCYHLIEQKLAGTLVAHLVDEDADPGEYEHLIPIKQAYYQLISNNVLSLDSFAAEDAGPAEKRIYAQFSARQRAVVTEIRRELLTLAPISYEKLTEDQQDYFDALYDVLLDKGILIRANIDTASELYTNYRKTGTISLQEYLRGALDKGWVDVTQLALDEKYNSSEQVYRYLVDLILDRIEKAGTFSKAVYEKLIYEDVLNRCDIALSLYEQGILKKDEEWIKLLETGESFRAFDFMEEKINNIEITPAQLALDPYSAAASVVDVTSGKVLAMVSYPGYDNNRMTDSSYYASLLADQSHPLFNSATQAQTAPGSIFKLVTTAASIDTGIITENTYLTTLGAFIGAGLEVHCWCWPGAHGDINVTTALKVSCNDFFCQLGYRLALVDGVYTDSVGIEKFQKYATMLGLGEKSGIEVPEYTPKISTTSSVTTAIGQGTNLYSNIHLARYVSTIASKGNVYDLTLLDRRTDAEGVLIQSYRGELVRKTELADNIWEAMQTGMHLSATQGSAHNVITDNVDIASKTGTAQENPLRPNHATFVSFAPYENPEIAVVATIPNGYTSTNTAELGSYIYDYYYGYITLEDILTGHAKDTGEWGVFD